MCTERTVFPRGLWQLQLLGLRITVQPMRPSGDRFYDALATAYETAGSPVAWWSSRRLHQDQVVLNQMLGL